jgi:hypothetical protein
MDALHGLAEWVQGAQNAVKFVTPLVGTAFVPENYWPKVDPRADDETKAAARETAIANATAAVLQGITLGLDPLTALQQIILIKGRPGMYAKIKIALLQAHGHEVWTEVNTDEKCVACGRRKGSEAVERVSITIEQARTAGWTTNETYAKTPADMLYARAVGRVCDRVAADVLMGIATVDDAADDYDNDATQPQRVVARVTAAEILGTATDATPTAEPPATAAPQPQPGMEIGRQRRLFALLKAKGYADKGAALAMIAIEIKREITSRNELTRDEGEQLIAKLDAMPDVVEEKS